MFDAIYMIAKQVVDQVDQVDHQTGNAGFTGLPAWSTIPAPSVHGVDQVDQHGHGPRDVGGPGDQQHAVGGPPGDERSATDSGALVHPVHLVHKQNDDDRKRDRLLADLDAAADLWQRGIDRLDAGGDRERAWPWFREQAARVDDLARRIDATAPGAAAVLLARIYDADEQQIALGAMVRKVGGL